MILLYGAVFFSRSPRIPLRSGIPVSAYTEQQSQQDIGDQRTAAAHGQERSIGAQISDPQIICNIDPCLNEEYCRTSGSHEHTELIPLL